MGSSGPDSAHRNRQYFRDCLRHHHGWAGIGKILAVLFSFFAVFASFGIGNMGQVASIRESVLNVMHFTGSNTADSLILDAAIALVAALVILGGISRIASANERIVPFMAVFYIAGSLV